MKKSLQHTLTAAMIALGMTSAAQAATVDVYITGSSAFRASVTNAIANMLATPVGAFEGSTAGADGTLADTTNAIASANQQIIKGAPNNNGTAAGLNGSNTYIFHTCWTGSLGGIATLAYGVSPTLPTGPNGSAVQHPYIGDGVTMLTVTPSNGQAGTNTNGGCALGSDQTSLTQLPSGGRFADGGFSDVFQSSTNLTLHTLTAATANSNSDGIVGVIPFVFVANPDLTSYQPGAAGTGAAIGSSYATDNMTATTAKAIYGGGIDLSQFTGNEADINGFVVATGRDADSGTRFTTFAETGFNPPHGTTLPQQYDVTQTGSSIDVSLAPGVNLFPGTSAEQDFSAGQSGYTSGKNERNALAISGTSGANSDNPSYVVGSLGESDAVTIMKAAGAGSSYMAYNGISYTNPGLLPTTNNANPFNRTLVEQGVYTFWGYEHCYLDFVNTANAAAINAVATRVRANEALIAGDSIANMAVERTIEGGPISYVGVGNSTK